MSMMYVMSLVSTMFLSYFYNKSKINTQKKIFVILIIISLTIISGLRFDTALYSDEWNYRYAFMSYIGKSLESLNLTLSDEPGFKMLSWFLANITHDSQYLIFICSFITNLSFVLFFYKYSKDFFFSTTLYITSGAFFTSMNIMRQYLAIAIVLFGFKHVLSQNFKKFLLYVIVAFFFHKSALVALVLYFIINSLMLEKHKALSFLVTALVMINFENIVQLFSNSTYGHYVESFSETGYGVGFTRIAFFSVFYFIIIWKEKLLIKNFKLNPILINSTFISWSILLISSIYVFVARLDYFNACTLLLIPLIPCCFKEHDRNFVKVGIYILFFIYGWYLTKDLTIQHLLF